MSLKVFAIRDSKADSYDAVHTSLNRGVAMRGFVDACGDERSALVRHPDDYNLYEVGEFDQSSGTITPYAVPQFVMSAVEALNYKKGIVSVQSEGVPS